MKRIISLVLITMIFVCSFNLSVNAATVQSSTEDLLDKYETGEILVKYEDAANRILEGLLNFEDDIDLTEYKITKNEFNSIYRSVIWQNPGIFYVDQTYVESTSSMDTGKILNIRPNYVINKRNYAQEKARLDQRVQRILQNIDTSWPAYRQLRYLHDELDTFIEYEKDVDTYGSSLYTTYGALVNNQALCHGYTLSFNYIANLLGFETRVVSSEAMNHTWSMVKIDGQWYHVDVTWDDPIADLAGRATHDYFLLSENKIKQLRPGVDWNMVPKATSTAYDNAWWQGVETFIYPIGDKDYYINHHYTTSEYGSLMARDTKTGQEEEIVKIKKRWYVDSSHTGIWKGNFSQLIYTGKEFYYNTCDSVYSIKPDGSDNKVVWEKPKTENWDIYGLTYDMDWNIYIELQSDPNTDGKLMKILINPSVDINPPVVDPTNPTDPSVTPTEPSETPTSPIVVPTEPIEKPTSPTDNITQKPTKPVVEDTVPQKVNVLNMKAGQSYKLYVTGSQNKKPVFTLDKKYANIVSVTKDGIAFALKKGTAIVNVKVGDIVIQNKIIVKNNPQLINSKNKAIKTIKVKKGSTTSIGITGKISSIKNVYYSTSNVKIKGNKNSSIFKIKAKKKGISTVKVKVNGVVTLKLKVKVS